MSTATLTGYANAAAVIAALNRTTRTQIPLTIVAGAITVALGNDYTLDASAAVTSITVTPAAAGTNGSTELVVSYNATAGSVAIATPATCYVPNGVSQSFTTVSDYRHIMLFETVGDGVSLSVWPMKVPA